MSPGEVNKVLETHSKTLRVGKPVSMVQRTEISMETIKSNSFISATRDNIIIIYGAT